MIDYVKKLLSMLGGRGASLFLQGAREGVEAGGDASRPYHRVSMLYRDYYGELEAPPSHDGYYKEYPGVEQVMLPNPVRSSGMDALEAIRSRRSRRSYSRKPLSLGELASILYYAVGITGRAWWGGPKRTYPSSGALQPLEAYVSVHRVEGISPGIYHYNPGRHTLEALKLGDYSSILEDAALGQEHVGRAPVVIILTAVYSRTASKYGQRSYRYVHWDTGFAGENIYIACEALGLATVAVGAFYDEELCGLLDIDCVWEVPMLLFPIGHRG